MRWTYGWCSSWYLITLLEKSLRPLDHIFICQCTKYFFAEIYDSSFSLLGPSSKNFKVSQYMVDDLVLEDLQCWCLYALFNDCSIFQQTLGKYFSCHQFGSLLYILSRPVHINMVFCCLRMPKNPWEYFYFLKNFCLKQLYVWSSIWLKNPSRPISTSFANLMQCFVWKSHANVRNMLFWPVHNVWFLAKGRMRTIILNWRQPTGRLEKNCVNQRNKGDRFHWLNIQLKFVWISLYFV